MPARFCNCLLLSPPAEAVGITSNDVDLAVAEEFLPCRHHVLATLGDRLDDGGFTAAVQPDLVGQVRRARACMPLPSGPWHANADLAEALLAFVGQHGVGRQTGQRADVVRSFLARRRRRRLPLPPYGGITPLRPLAIVSMICSGSPPHSQSPSARFGKPFEPLASEPWHCMQ